MNCYKPAPSTTKSTLSRINFIPRLSTFRCRKDRLNILLLKGEICSHTSESVNFILCSFWDYMYQRGQVKVGMRLEYQPAAPAFSGCLSVVSSVPLNKTQLRLKQTATVNMQLHCTKKRLKTATCSRVMLQDCSLHDYIYNMLTTSCSI